MEPGDTDDAPPIYVTMTEEQVMAAYYPYWSRRMVRAGRVKESEDKSSCLSDWVVVNWAWESDASGNALPKGPTSGT